MSQSIIDLSSEEDHQAQTSEFCLKKEYQTKINGAKTEERKNDKFYHEPVRTNIK